MAIEFSEDMEVQTVDGKKVGMIERVVVDPISNDVTHVVVRKGFIFTEDRLIPIEAFIASDDDEIRFIPSVENLDDFPVYEETHYVTSQGYEGKPYLDWSMRPLFYYPPAEPALNPPPPADDVQVEGSNLPPSTVVVDENTRVLSLDDDDLGTVEKVITNDHGEITHLVISKGVIFSSERLIPIGWVRQIADNQVRLHVRNETVDGLPEYED